MAVLQHEGAYKLVRFEISPSEFPSLLRQGIGTNGRLQQAEDLARSLIDYDFSAEKSTAFVRAVCLWGGDPRRGGKVIKNNKKETISDALRTAYGCSCRDDLAGALKAVTSLHGLSVSFGSKHLKFLAPDRHIVLDKIIRERFGYTNDMNGYLHWLAACHEFLALVRQENIEYPGIGKNGWRVCDIEMAIFNKIRGE